DQKWSTFLAPKLRYLSTVHFMDKGYWVWIIPLGSKNTSIGIVADPDIHPLESINTYEKAVEWMKVNEPQCAQHICPPKDELLDFKVLKHFAHSSKRLYSSDRWAMIGDAGVFLDPFYSPGSDFISLTNTWLSDLILRDLAGEDIAFRTEIYERTHLSWFESWLPIYEEKYKLMGNPQIMVIKIFWDWAIYWSVPCVLFTNNGFTDLKILKELFASDNSVGIRFQKLNKAMQDLFLEWLPNENESFSNRYIDPFDLSYLRTFQQGITDQHPPRQLVEKIKANVEILEKIAAEVFRHISNQVHGTSMDIRVNPYTISLSKPVDTTSDMALDVDFAIREDVDTMWFYNKELAM
ncbi:MAG: hypothetical protein K2Q22_01150, partial [Cytophagales bacterium]|nr:hypothetical protein [Cytophagales bacterium]